MSDDVGTFHSPHSTETVVHDQERVFARSQGSWMSGRSVFHHPIATTILTEFFGSSGGKTENKHWLPVMISYRWRMRITYKCSVQY
jgi:hypothetical protein